MSWRRPEAAGERASGIAQSCRRRDAPRPAADGLDETEVVDQETLGPDEEIAVLGDVEIEHRLSRVGLDGPDFDRAADPLRRATSGDRTGPNSPFLTGVDASRPTPG